MATRTRKPRVTEEIAPTVEAPAPKLSWVDRLLLSEQGRKLAAPMSDDEKRTATSGVVTGAAILLTGPVAGSIAAVGITAIDSNSTKANWQGVGSTACSTIALAAVGAGALAASLGGLAATGIGMIANRLNRKEEER